VIAARGSPGRRGREYRRLLPSIVAAIGLLVVPVVTPAQESPPFSLDQVAEAVAADLGTRILERARMSCVSFVVDATTERRLRAAGADASFTTALRDVCHRGTSLRVTTDPAGAEVWVQEQLVGRSPWTSPMPVLRNTVVEVRRGGRQRRVTVDMVADSLVSVAMAMPRDTFPLPPLPPESELQSLGARAGNFDARSRPTPPAPPAQGRGVTSTILGGLAGAAAGVVAGTLLCRRDVQQYESDTVAGVPFRRPAGTTTELRRGCVGFSFGGGAVTGGVAGNVWSGATIGRRRRRYDERLRIYERQLARWEDQRLATERLRELEGRRAKRERIAAQNAAIVASNRNLGPPRISIEPAVRLSRAVPNSVSR